MYQDNLWEDLSFFVVRGDFEPSALPVDSTFIESKSRQLALAATFHGLDPYVEHEQKYAASYHYIFESKQQWSIIVPPSDVWRRTGMTTWQTALAKQYGDAWAFSTDYGLKAVAHYRATDDGIEVRQVDDMYANDGEVLGINKPIENVDEVLGAMQTLMGVKEIKSLLRLANADFYSYL